MESGDVPKRSEDILKLLTDIKEGRVPATEKPFDLRGASLAGLDLSGLDISGVDLSGADLTGCDLTGAKLFKANLNNATLMNAKLKGAELSGADLTDANLEEIDAEQAGFGMACLKGAHLFQANLEGSTLSMANFMGADLRGANLRNARMREAKLLDTDFTNADLRNTDMSLSNVTGATFNNTDMREARLRLVSGYEKANWIGVDIRNINFAGAYGLRRFAHDQNYIKEFRSSGRLSSLIYYLWWVTSDCGRSMVRWCLWIVILAFFFGWMYTFVDIDYGDHRTSISSLYFSVVTLTTLGYGDVTPVSISGQVVAMIEVITGYIMLGGLLSIFSNKIARRAD